MRSRAPRLLVAVLLVAGPALVACGGGTTSSEEDAGRSSTSSASPSPSTAGETASGDEAGGEDTYAEVADPATERVPLEDLEGFEDVRLWEGTDVSTGPTQVFGGLDLDAGEAAVSIAYYPSVLARGSSEAEMRYWLKRSNLVDEPPREADPVVVDGVEWLRAQGVSSVGTVDHFVRGVEDLTVFIDFVLPAELPAAQREELIGQVMSTVQLDPALR